MLWPASSAACRRFDSAWSCATRCKFTRAAAVTPAIPIRSCKSASLKCSPGVRVSRWMAPYVFCAHVSGAHRIELAFEEMTLPADLRSSSAETSFTNNAVESFATRRKTVRLTGIECLVVDVFSRLSQPVCDVNSSDVLSHSRIAPRSAGTASAIIPSTCRCSVSASWIEPIFVATVISVRRSWMRRSEGTMPDNSCCCRYAASSLRSVIVKQSSTFVSSNVTLSPSCCASESDFTI